MTWTLRDAKQDQEIVEKIDGGDDRSAAILAEALLEDRLTKCLLAHLKDDNVVVGKMFKGYGPLASFGAKLDLAYLMEIINERELQVLNRVKEIRNRFAHRLEAHSFDVPMIKDLCPQLLQHDQVKGLCVALLQEFEENKDMRELL
jgi:DNA-binding MltR family transcriptional regulator